MRANYEEAIKDLYGLISQFKATERLLDDPPTRDADFLDLLGQQERQMDALAQKLSQLARDQGTIRRQLFQRAQELGVGARLIQQLMQRTALSVLGPEGIKETHTLSEITHALSARTRALRKWLDQGAEPVFRRLMKESGYLESARKALKEGTAASKQIAATWEVFSKAEAKFLQMLWQQAQEQYRAYIQVQKSEGA